MRLNLYLYPGATTEADGVLRSAIPPSLDGLLYPGATSSTDGVLRFQILVPAPAESTSEASPVEVAFLDSTATVYGPSVGAAVAAVAIGSGATVPAPAIGAGIVAGFVASAAVVYAPTVESGSGPEPEPSYGRHRPAPPVPAKKRKPKKKPAPLFVERPAVVVLPPLVPVGAEWADPVADEEAAVVAALYALNVW